MCCPPSTRSSCTRCSRRTSCWAFHTAKGIVTESGSPLGRGSDLLDDPVLVQIAEALGVTPGQVVLRWHTQLGAVPVPKSSSPERQRRNLDVFGFELGPEQLRAVSARPRRRLGGDPEVHEEF